MFTVTLEEATLNEVRLIAKKEKRSVSQMIDLLLQKAILIIRQEERRLL